MATYVIECSTTETFTEVVAGLIKEGLCFTAVEYGSGWKITLTGGY